jgi:hypothetical protein
MDSFRPIGNQSDNHRHLLLLVGVISLAVFSGLTGVLYSVYHFIWPIAAIVTVMLLAGVLWRIKTTIHTEDRPGASNKAPETPPDLNHVAKKHLKDIVDSISDGFILWDKDNRLLLHNR